MDWGSVVQFLSMGGKAWFVWGSYAVTLIIITAEVWALRNRCKRAVEEVRRSSAEPRGSM